MIGILRHPLIARNRTGCLADFRDVTLRTPRARRSLIETAVSRGVERYFLKQLWDRDVSQLTSHMVRTMLSHIVVVAHRLDHGLGPSTTPERRETCASPLYALSPGSEAPWDVRNT